MPDHRASAGVIMGGRTLQDVPADPKPVLPVCVEPIQVKEPPGAGELVTAVQGDGVMDQGGRQAVIPGGSSIVQVRSGIPGDVQAAPPQVEMQLVGVRGAGAELCDPQDGPGVLAIDMIAQV